MSSRALRKLHGEEGPAGGLSEILPDEGSSEEIKPAVRNKKKKKKVQKPSNPFDLLQEDTQENGVDSEEDGEAEGEDTSHQQEESTEAVTNPKGKKKKKKKKKSPADVKENNKLEDEAQEDDIDKGIREVNAILGPPPVWVSSQEKSITAAMRALLSVEHKHLNPDNEMRRIFGSIVKNDMRKKARNQKYLRSTWLTIPKPSWPNMGKHGLSMKKLKSKGEYHFFTYEHSQDYQQVQFKFLDSVESMNPQNIMGLVQEHPYHVDSLLQLSNFSRMSEDLQMAVELIERSLFSCECAFHPLFNVTQGNCRLDYRRPENRALYIALFKHIKYVGQRGCNRTAVEFCKVLLSFGPDDDPLGTLLMIDYYALKSEQYEFLRRLYNEWEAHKNLSQLPNHAFSWAMLYFYLSRTDEKLLPRADTLLQDALLMFPLVLLPLLDRCNIQPNKEVEKHPFFANSTQFSEPPALFQLTKLFIARNYVLWKETEVSAWLETNVQVVIKRLETDTTIAATNKDKRNMRYQHAPRNIYRHIILAELKDVTTSLPSDLASEPMMAFDPLPPTDSIVSYTRPPRQRLPAGNNHWMSEFFRSLMPSYNPPPPGQVGLDNNVNQDEGAVGGNYLAPDTDLRQGLNTLMDSMRDLLQALQPNPDDEDEDVEEVD